MGKLRKAPRPSNKFGLDQALTSMSARHIELRIDSNPANLAAVRKAVESFAQASGFDDKAIGDIGLCVNETLANVIEHAYRGRTNQPIEIRVEDQNKRLVVYIRDWGAGIDPSALPQQPYDPLTPGGVGLICIKQLMDEVSYKPQPDGMLTTMVKVRR